MNRFSFFYIGIFALLISLLSYFTSFDPGSIYRCDMAIGNGARFPLVISTSTKANVLLFRYIVSLFCDDLMRWYNAML